MILQIDIHPSMIGSPKEIGELVEKQMIREAEGKPRVSYEDARDFSRGLMGNLKNKETFLETLSGKKIYE